MLYMALGNFFLLIVSSLQRLLWVIFTADLTYKHIHIFIGMSMLYINQSVNAAKEEKQLNFRLKCAGLICWYLPPFSVSVTYTLLPEKTQNHQLWNVLKRVFSDGCCFAFASCFYFFDFRFHFSVFFVWYHHVSS